MELESKNSTYGSRPSSSILTQAHTPAWRVPIGPIPYGSADASLFSTSLPVISHQKPKFSVSEKSFRTFDDEFPGLDKLKFNEVKDPLEENVPSTEGAFLPGDEDELLAGLMDDLYLSGLPTQLVELDDDFFGSGGGMEIEFENHEYPINSVSRLVASDGISGGIASHFGFANGVGTVSGEHPLGEHPSRTLFVRNINSNVEDFEIASLFEQYGDIRTLYTACKHRGFVMISYYDIRAARAAMRSLQNKPLRRRKLDIHFSIPKDNPSEKDINQGTLVVFNLDPSVSNDDLLQIFGTYGEVKEIRETPHKKHHKFIEFFDVRDAEAALKALNRSDIAGKRIKLEPSRPGGSRRGIMQQLNQEQDQDEARVFHHQVGSPVANSPPGSWPTFGSPVDQNSLNGLRVLSPLGTNNLSGLASVLSTHVSSPVKISPIGKDSARTPVIPMANTTHFSVPEMKLCSSPAPVSSFSDSKASSSVGTLTGPQFLWGSPTILSEQIGNSSPWSSSLKGREFATKPPGVGFHNSVFGSRHHVCSAPTGIPLERHFGFLSESPDTFSYMNQVSFGLGTRVSMNMGVGSPGSRLMPMPRNSPMYYGNGSFGGMGASMNNIMDLNRSRSQMDNKQQYQLDLEKIMNGEDNRTTLMIKNIPNKYTSKMLLTAIDETHKGTYDFLYLPIDFKNKCNVGYAFKDMSQGMSQGTFSLLNFSHFFPLNACKDMSQGTEARIWLVVVTHLVEGNDVGRGDHVDEGIPKIISLAYARIQGRTALVSHFQNTSLMNEDKRCRPILFQSDNLLDSSSFPCGNMNIFIRQADGSYAGDSLDSPNGDDDSDDM